MRMIQQKPPELFAGVTGSADDSGGYSCCCHNAQCVFRLAPIATNFLVTIKTFRATPFSVTSRNYGRPVSCRNRRARGFWFGFCDHPLQLFWYLASGAYRQRAGGDG